MKKLLLMSIVFILVGSVSIVEAETKLNSYRCPCEQSNSVSIILDDNLNLSDAQLKNVQQLFKETNLKIQQIKNQIQDKNIEARAVKLSRIAIRMQQEKLAQLSKEIQDLQQQAYQARKDGIKAIEKTLSWKQRRILRKTNNQYYKIMHRGCVCPCLNLNDIEFYK